VRAVSVKLTKNDLILLAAKKLPQPFTTEDLVVASWQLDKTKFGLDGFTDQYPNNNKVLVCLMGAKGLVKQGRLTKVSNGRYRTKN
jgi:hypothetical protein